LTIFPFVQSSSIFIQKKTCTNISFSFKQTTISLQK
jgi:hypothetical protein